MYLRVLLAVLLLTPTFAAAQELRPPTTRLAEVAGALATTSVSQFQAPTQYHCCNAKGAIIGAAIGTAIGFWFARNLCDAGSCASAYVEDIALFAGIGATLGMFADRSPGVGVFPSKRRVQLGCAITPRVRVGIVRVGF